MMIGSHFLSARNNRLVYPYLSCYLRLILLGKFSEVHNAVMKLHFVLLARLRASTIQKMCVLPETEAFKILELLVLHLLVQYRQCRAAEIQAVDDSDHIMISVCNRPPWRSSCLRPHNYTKNKLNHWISQLDLR